MSEFERTYSGARWETEVGYCRGLRAGEFIFITGTAPMNEDGTVHAPGDAGRQTTRCFEIIEQALHDLGAAKRDVIVVRLYVTDISRAAEIGEAHRRFFDGHHPTTTMVGVSALVDPAMLIEIEVQAHHPAGRGG